MQRRRFLAAGALAAAALAARAQESRELVDAAGRKVRLPARVGRIFAAGPPASILVFAVAPDALVGWTTPFRDHERPFVAEKYASLPALGRLTGRGNTANIEVVLAARPDVILDYGAVNPTYVSLADRVQAQTGIPYVLLDGDFDRIAESLEQVGRMTGETARGTELARYARVTLAEEAARIAKIPRERRPRVYYARGPAGLDTGLAGSINAEWIEQMGAANVAAELGRGGLVRVSVEQVLRWNPDVIVTIDPNFFASVWRDPLWRDIAAVKAKRVYLAPNAPFGWIDFPPSVNRLIGLRWLARVLYPETFADDLRPIVRDFYARFYHQAPSDAQVERLLASTQT